MAGPRAQALSLLRPRDPDARRRSTACASSPRSTSRRNPVMFVVEVGSVAHHARLAARPVRAAARRAADLVHGARRRLALVHGALRELRRGGRRGPRQGAGGHAAPDAQGDRSRAGARTARVEEVPASQLRAGDVVVVSRPASSSPATARSIEGIASVDESAITGESAPVIRESGGDRSAVTGGTRVLSDRIVVRITREPRRVVPRPHDRAGRGRRAPEDARTRSRCTSCSSGLTIVFLFACVTLVPLALYCGVALSRRRSCALLVCLIPTTIGGLLSAIGIAGMDRLLRKNVLAMSGRAVEAAGDVDTLLLDKTGTITLGNRMATELLPVRGRRASRSSPTAAQLASLADETPEGRSIVVLVQERYAARPRARSTPGARSSSPSPRRRA